MLDKLPKKGETVHLQSNEGPCVATLVYIGYLPRHTDDIARANLRPGWQFVTLGFSPGDRTAGYAVGKTLVQPKGQHGSVARSRDFMLRHLHYPKDCPHGS